MPGRLSLSGNRGRESDLIDQRKKFCSAIPMNQKKEKKKKEKKEKAVRYVLLSVNLRVSRLCRETCST